MIGSEKRRLTEPGWGLLASHPTPTAPKATTQAAIPRFAGGPGTVEPADRHLVIQCPSLENLVQIDSET